ncbi:fasciclin domain-containing protein [Neolewinella lacunae]|uniref:Fasciclin domain-containing protein n=1 Tax=Neolewinella lacunae TaxID=1517758 RepID=A0A923PLZ9_9BACT|nr:fasciclin domain-containing protein [Neolewinella lacunae]MBC6996495.1 fasciclin domain-containing protein [Neolewinella lacunae]MDN3636648.1 fasciclin domain-containing protein [Neolewinella lacunae]
MKRIFLSLLTLVSLSFFVPATIAAQDMSDKNIVEIAAGNDDFSTLVTAVKAAGLAETLMGEGPFTVFAPTNAAFDALPAGLVEALVKPENKATLQKILTYHVVAGKLPATDVVAGIKSNGGTLSATTVSGGGFSVMQDMNAVKIKDGKGSVATVVTTDIMASNGVIHVIDKVLIPADVDPAALLKKKMGAMEDKMGTMDDQKMEEGKMMTTRMEAKSGQSKMMTSNDGPTIVAAAKSNNDFSTLTTAIGAAGLVETFEGAGEYTVFAPTNKAFDALPEGTVNNLVTNDKETLKGILAYHVVPARLTAGQLTAAIKANKNYYVMQTLGGQSIVATIKDGKVQIIDGNGNRSTVVTTDVNASNGVIHAIDTVIMPKSK